MGNTIQSWKYDQRIPSELDYCATVIKQLLDQLEKFNWPNKDVFGIHMAMEEAITNAIRHGNKCASDKDVHIVMSISQSMFTAKVTDQGCGFDPDALPDPTRMRTLKKLAGVELC